MDKRCFYVVDVFAEEKYSGNQLAVFTETEGLSDDEMLKFTKEMNYSESTFILSPEKRKGGYDVRIFTPEKELPFAGHPTLGTAYVIYYQMIKKPVDKIILNLKVGQIPVTLHFSQGEIDFLWMRQKFPTFGQEFDKETISPTLSLHEDDVDERFPVQEVSTGLPFIIVPLKTLQAVKQAAVVRTKFLDLIKNTEAKDILVFCPETYKKENNLNVRVFAEFSGVPEDPATGSANGCLAGYLVKYRYFGRDKINIRVEQGYEMARPSLLLLKAEKREEDIEVNVGGKVVMVARGEFV